MNKIYQKPFPAGKNTGFTLIELLVVVLIIGVLAAVALLQYRVAVEKARAAQMFVRINALRTGAQSYHLANNIWPNDVTVLDVDVTSGAKSVGKTSNTSAEHIGVVYPDGSQCSTAEGITGCLSKVLFMYNYPDSASILCRGKTELGDKVCKALGGKNPQDGGGSFPNYTLP